MLIIFGLFRLPSSQTCVVKAAVVARESAVNKPIQYFPLGTILGGVTLATAEVTDATLSLNAPSNLPVDAHVAVSKTVSCSLPPRLLASLRNAC